MQRPKSKCVTRIVCAVGAVMASGGLIAQVDPGPRGGVPGAGSYYGQLNSTERLSFNTGLTAFNEIDSVSGNVPGASGSGLGPTFNGNSCAMCHAQPAVGGSSPGLRSKQLSTSNPQVALANLNWAANLVPSFITVDGPVREARFVRQSAGPDGGVHGLYTIEGRSDAPGCRLAQPDFEQAVATHNVIFRIPTPTFGLGLVENTPDATLAVNLSANQAAKSKLGIGGHLNTSGNDGSVTRFGWKAQNKSLLIFAAEAYNVEQGVSNELFPNERSVVAGCVFNATPEDRTAMTPAKGNSDPVNFAIFMRLSAPPAPVTSSTSETNGQSLFAAVGCALCHTPTLATGLSPYTGMSNVSYHPYSDFAVHSMGAGLADGISQGNAVGDQFRTAPLWGLGQRLFFLHDGRAGDLLQAIQAHASSGSEADQVISQFSVLSISQKQDILNFLRSL